jgi:hypothetical protein
LTKKVCCYSLKKSRAFENDVLRKYTGLAMC